MFRRTTLTAAAIVALAGGVVPLGGPTASAAPAVTCRTQLGGEGTPRFTADSVRLSATSVAPSGTKTAPVTVTAHAGWTGAPRADYGSTCIRVGLSRAPVLSIANQQQWPKRYVSLRLVSGTPTDGVYSGTTQIPSTLSGTLTADEVISEDAFADEYRDPAKVTVNGPTLKVAGSHVPRIVGLTSAPSPVPARAKTFTITGRIVDASTGRGYANAVPVSICDGDFGSYHRIGQTVRTQPKTGVFTATVPATAYDPGLGFCATLTPGGVSGDPEGLQRIAVATAHYRVLGTMTAPAVRGSVPAGTTVGVRGRLDLGGRYAGGLTVELQRQYARGVFRKVGSAAVNGDGTFRLVAQPKRGRFVYRAAMTGTDTWDPVVSPAFAITGR